MKKMGINYNDFTPEGSERIRKRFKELYNQMPGHRKRDVDYVLNPKRSQKHRLHMVAPSPGPLYTSLSAFLLVLGLLFGMHGEGTTVLKIGVFLICSAIYFGFRDIIREGLYMGYHTKIVQRCLRTGFVLFLVSEVMFFFGFFGALFHFSLVPGFWSGNVGPSEGIALYIISEDINAYPGDYKYHKKLLDNVYGLNPANYQSFMFMFNKHELLTFNTELEFPNLITVPIFKNNEVETPLGRQITHTKFGINVYHPGVLINPFGVPLINTFILLTSGAFLTLAHSLLRTENFKSCLGALFVTIALGVGFFFLQLSEYSNAGYSINDGIYGSVFYMLTGFHGFHVFVGTAFLIVCFFRTLLSHFTSNNHFAFEAAAGYGHFVDVVGIGVYAFMYLGPSARFYMEPKIFLNVYPPSIHIEYSALYLPEDFSFDPSIINYPLGLNKKIELLNIVTNHFSDKILAFDTKIAKLQLMDILEHPRFDFRVYLFGDRIHPCKLYLLELERFKKVINNPELSERFRRIEIMVVEKGNVLYPIYNTGKPADVSEADKIIPVGSRQQRVIN